VMNYINVSLLN